MFQKPMRNDILIKRWQESNFSTKLNVEWRIAWNLTPDAWSFWEQEDQSKIKQIILCLLSVHSNCWWLLLTEYSFKSPKLFRVFVQSFSLFSGQTKRKLFILTPGYLLLTHIYILWQHSFTTRPTHCLIIARSHLPSLPPFLDFSQLQRLLFKLQYVVWFCSALSEKLAMAKYSKFYLAPEITWYWLASSLHQASGYHHSLC